MSKRWSYKVFDLITFAAESEMNAAGADGYRLVFVTQPATASAPCTHYRPLGVMEREEPATDKENTTP
jgi:hypothetical protein